MQGNWFKPSLIPWDYPNVYGQSVYHCFLNGLEKRRQNPLPARASTWVTDLKSWTSSYPLQINRTTSKTHADQISNLACKCSYISWDSLWPICREGACEWLQRCWKNCLAKRRIQVLWKSLTLGWRRTKRGLMRLTIYICWRGSWKSSSEEFRTIPHAVRVVVRCKVKESMMVSFKVNHYTQQLFDRKFR